jgi:uncharacterized protein (DUF1499 family)
MIFAGKRPNHLGVRDGQLTPCPNTPNCVSSQSSDAVHKIEPLSLQLYPRTSVRRDQTPYSVVTENQDNHRERGLFARRVHPSDSGICG